LTLGFIIYNKVLAIYVNFMKVGAYHGIKTYPQGIKGLAKGPSNIMQCRYRLIYQWIYE